MIINHSCSSPEETWQAKFVLMLPEIQRLLRIAFTNLKLEARTDAMDEALFHCLWSYFTLVGSTQHVDRVVKGEVSIV